MNYDRISEKISILADAAKYDVSCASSGSNRKKVIKESAMPPMASVMLTPKMAGAFRC